MRILALETSGMAGSVAAFEGTELLAEIELDRVRRTARTLAPALRDLLKQVGWKPAEVNLVAVTRGPGSFTGLRIGVTTAKTFAYATGAALVGVDTLTVISQAIQGELVATGETRLWAVMNAEREQLFAAAFHRSDARWDTLEATRIVDQQDWLDRLAPGWMVTGPGLKDLVPRIPSGVRIASEAVWTPTADQVGREGLRAFREGRQSDCWSLVPAYFRESAAVEKRFGFRN